MDMGRGEERVRCMERVTWKLTLPYVKQIPTGIYCMSQETQTGALYQPRGERDGREAQMGGDYKRGNWGSQKLVKSIIGCCRNADSYLAYSMY